MLAAISRKSRLVVQIVADVMQMPIDVLASDQSVALGAAMFAAVAAGIYETVPEAQEAMTPAVERRHTPDSVQAGVYDRLYAKYRKLGSFIEAIAQETSGVEGV